MPSGKDADYENFPVGSWLLPKAVRGHVAVFYRFARTIDDIADSPYLDSQEKIEKLDRFEAAIRNEDVDQDLFAVGVQMRRSLAKSGVSVSHCENLIQAFKQDALKQRYQTWDQLVAYCMLSAAPVGRYLIDLTGGARDGYTSSDALCVALQVINHLQDCKDDFQTLNRVYLPQDWLRDANADESMLVQTSVSVELGDVLKKCLHEVRQLLTVASPLPRQVRSRRLAMEAAAIHNVAVGLTEKLSVHDVLQHRVVLSKPKYFQCMAAGAFQGLFR